MKLANKIAFITSAAGIGRAIYRAALCLVSDDASFVTGAAFSIGGGLSR